tara:strand:- start:702 stop:983 length:282 start_codon:yes stop_codon:yes gene_type:complete
MEFSHVNEEWPKRGAGKSSITMVGIIDESKMLYKLTSEETDAVVVVGVLRPPQETMVSTSLRRIVFEVWSRIVVEGGREVNQWLEGVIGYGSA